MFYVRPESGEPIYIQLIRQIKHAIISGALAPDERLPTVRQLAAELVINPNTVARAYRQLEREGLLDSAPGRGTFVRMTPSGMRVDERRKRLHPYIESLIAEASVLGFTIDELVAMIKKASGTR